MFSFPKPKLAVSHAPDCSALYLRDVTGADCFCPVANYERRWAVCRTLTVLDGQGNLVSTGGAAQVNCLQLTGNPVAGDRFRITLNNCLSAYTVTAADIATSTETRACAFIDFNVTGTPTLPCTATCVLTVGGILINFTLAYNASPFVLAQNAATAITAALTALNYQTQVSAVASSTLPRLTICVSPSWYQDTFGGTINNTVGTLTFSGCNMAVIPATFTFTGGVTPSTTPQQQTRDNVLTGIYNLLTGQIPTGTDECGNPIYPCPVPLKVGKALCNLNCQLTLTALYPGEPFTVTIEQILQPTSTANLQSVVQVPNQCNMKPATSADTDKDTVIINTPKDDIYCTRFTIVWQKPAYYYRCLNFSQVTTGQVINVTIDHNGDLSLSYTFTTVSNSATANAETFVVNYSAMLAGLGIAPYDVYVERTGTTVCIYLRDNLYTDTSTVTITATADAANILYGSGDNTFNQLLPSLTETMRADKCYADLCRMECCFVKAILQETEGCECPADGCLTKSAYIKARMDAVDRLLCQGDICGAKKVLAEFQVFWKGCGC